MLNKFSGTNLIIDEIFNGVCFPCNQFLHTIYYIRFKEGFQRVKTFGNS